MNELGIQFMFITSNKYDNFIKWLNSEIDRLNGDENILQAKLYYKKTLSLSADMLKIVSDNNWLTRKSIPMFSNLQTKSSNSI